jgi:hypothetical protein
MSAWGLRGYAKVPTVASPTFCFKTFNALYKSRFPGRKVPSYDFLTWLIGFSEVDGCFRVYSNLYVLLFFTVAQGAPNVKVLEYIKENLGIGQIHKTKQDVFVYQVTSSADLRLIIAIFNGHLIVPSRMARFETFVAGYNLQQVKSLVDPNLHPYIQLKPNLLCPSLLNNWLRGYTEAEGCFSCTIHLYGYSVGDTRAQSTFTCQLYLSLKGVFSTPLRDNILSMWGVGSYYLNKRPDHYRISFCGVVGAGRISAYLENGKFVGIQERRYQLYKLLVADAKDKVHYTLHGAMDMKRRCGAINDAYKDMRKAKNRIEAWNKEVLPVIPPHPLNKRPSPLIRKP